MCPHLSEIDISLIEGANGLSILFADNTGEGRDDYLGSLIALELLVPGRMDVEEAPRPMPIRVMDRSRAVTTTSWSSFA